MSEKTPDAESVLWTLIQTFLENYDIKPTEDLETARLISIAICYGVYNSLHSVVHGYEMPNKKVVPIVMVDFAEAAEATLDQIQEEIDEDEEDGESEEDWVQDEAYVKAFATRLNALRKAFGQTEDIPDKPEAKDPKSKDDDDGSGVGALSETFAESVARIDPHYEMTKAVAGTTLEAQMELDNQMVPEAELRGQKAKPDPKKAN